MGEVCKMKETQICMSWEAADLPIPFTGRDLLNKPLSPSPEQSSATQSPPSLAEQAYTVIEEMIVTLRLPPGTIFSEADLSEEIAIGRTPMREALQRLANERLLTAMPRRGILVTEVKITDMLALLETRRTLERLVSAKAARRATVDHHLALRACAEAIVAAAEIDDIGEFMRQDRAFDEVLGIASRNSFAQRALQPLHAHCRRFWYLFKNSGDLRHSAALHAEVMNAVVSGNEQGAADASDKLIDYLEQFTRTAMDLT